MQFLYNDDDDIETKINKVANYYGAGSISFTKRALRELELIKKLKLSHLPICVAKTQYSLSCNAKLLGRPEGFDVRVRSFYISSGAGFIVVVTGSILRMPGLPKVPSANLIDINEEGEVVGLF